MLVEVSVHEFIVEYFFHWNFESWTIWCPWLTPYPTSSTCSSVSCRLPTTVLPLPPSSSHTQKILITKQFMSLLKDVPEEHWPSLTLAIFIAKPIPFIREFLSSVEKLIYPSSKIDIYLYNNQKYNEKDVSCFMVIFFLILKSNFVF